MEPKPEGEPKDKETETASAALVLRADEPMVMDVGRSLPQARAQFQAIQEFVKSVMVEGEDYGKVEGIAKPFLFKSGAEKLATLFGYAPVYVTLEKIEDWAERKALGFFFYRYRCDLKSKTTGQVMGTGIGSCNSMEDKYRWVAGQRVCPECKKPAIIKGRAEYGGGWLCFAKRGGCGFKWPDGHAAIEGQSVERVERETFSQVNTIDKMAQKRALVAATLIATGTSSLFTQDEDAVETHEEKPARVEVSTPAKPPAPTAAPSTPAAAPANGPPSAYRANLHAGDCNACGQRVEKQAGYIEKVGGDWKVRHHAKDCRNVPAETAAR